MTKETTDLVHVCFSHSRRLLHGIAQLVAGFICVVAPAALAQYRPVSCLDGSSISVDDIDKTVRAAMRDAHVPGVGIAIFNHGKVAYLRTYGLGEMANHHPLTPDSVMTAASLTKPVFATLVLQLVKQRVLDLDRPVYKYLPNPLPSYAAYRDLGSDRRFELITLRMLLDHTSGLPNWRQLADDHKLRLYFLPGSRFAYSGEGIDLAQFVVETVTQKKVGTLMRERIFGPLGMTRTSMTWNAEFEDDFANGYDESGHSLGPQRRKIADAAGSMQTTLRDYARFVQAMINGEILDQHLQAAMFAPQVRIMSAHEFPTLATETTQRNNAIRLGYGLGWGLYWSRYGKVFFKEGHDDGWRHYFVCFDKPRSGLLIMTNSSNGEDLYGKLLETLIRDVDTPYEWEGFRRPGRS